MGDRARCFVLRERIRRSISDSGSESDTRAGTRVSHCGSWPGGPLRGERRRDDHAAPHMVAAVVAGAVVDGALRAGAVVDGAVLLLLRPRVYAHDLFSRDPFGLGLEVEHD